MTMKCTIGACWILLVLSLTPSVAGQSHDPQVESYDAAKLAQYSSAELMDFLSAPSFEKNVHSQGIYSTLPPDRDQHPAPSGFGETQVFAIKIDSQAMDFAADIERELVRRRPIGDIVQVFVNTSDRAQRAWMLDILSQLRGSGVDAALRPFVTDSLDDTNYLALKYFAQACDPTALFLLNKHYFKYSVSSPEWASIVRIFGQCKYVSAADNLALTLFAADIDLGYASNESLKAIYPNADVTAGDPMSIQRDWKAYIASHRS